MPTVSPPPRGCPGRVRGILPLALVLLGLTLGARAGEDHYRIHPKTPPEGVYAWREEAVRGDLEICLEWAKPEGNGPFPAVLVHPEAGAGASDMRGILYSLAGEGYLAAAADYRRREREGGRFKKTLYPWKDPEDPEAALEILLASPFADPGRAATLGFSQGGVFSLIIAAMRPEDVHAVVAYYPVTDFSRWMNHPGYGWGRRLVFRFVRRHFYKQSGARSQEEFEELLDRASPLLFADRIVAPVLLIHGDRDTSAYPEESERLAARLRELDRTVELRVIQGGKHVFNFLEEEQAAEAWAATLGWLEAHLAGGPAGPSPPPPAGP